MNPEFDATQYTRDALAQELYLIELHSKDGSAVEADCACIQEKHLLGVAGLASEGILLGKSEKEREFYAKVAELARKLRKSILYAEFEMPHNPVRGEGSLLHVPVCDKRKFDSKSFRVIPLGPEGIKATIACPKGKFKGGECKIGTVVQRIMFPREEFTRLEAQHWVKEHQIKCRV